MRRAEALSHEAAELYTAIALPAAGLALFEIGIWFQPIRLTLRVPIERFNVQFQVFHVQCRTACVPRVSPGWPGVRLQGGA